MSLSASIREQLLESFRTELAEHIQTMTDGLLALEQGKLIGETRKTTLDEIFRAAHSLKGAARAVGVIAIEQLAHNLESVLDSLRGESLGVTPALFTACYQALDAIQIVQAAYETGETTPPTQALQALGDLEALLRKPAHPDARPTEQSLLNQESKEQLEVSNNELLEVESPLLEQDIEIAGLIKPNIFPVVSPSIVETSSSVSESVPSAINRSLSNDETIRVSVSKLDALMAQLSELLVTKLHAKQRLAEINHLQENLTVWQKDWLLARSSYNRLQRQDVGTYLSPTDATYANISIRHPNGALKNGKGRARLQKDTLQLLRYTGESQEQLHQMNGLVNALAREYANDTMQLSLVIEDMEQEIKRMRMLPLSTITASFRRMVRDLAKEAGKEATLQIIGSETELDKRVLEQIKDPLIHLLRNAIDHGIETPEKRLSLGKSPTGTITLSAEQVGQDVRIWISDDGSGLDLDAVRRAITKQGYTNTDSLNERELTETIFNVGISTSSIITKVSGRGVGLDVVRRNVEALHGRITMDWKLGQGTTFTLSLPLTLTSSHGLLVSVVGQLFVIPFNGIVRILSINPDEVFTLEGKDHIYLGEEPIMVTRLADVLELSHDHPSTKKDRFPVVVVAGAERRLAFAVDELAGEQEMVVKSLGKQLSRVGGIAGVTVMGDGQVVLILNMNDLIKLAIRGTQRSVFKTLVETEKNTTNNIERHVLVVDDSMTTRTLEKNILEAAGYIVELANDGQEAWETIQSNGKPDLIVSDIAMPRLNGFDLTRNIKENAKTANIPVILVTSLDSPEDKARGIEAGADAYIIKSRFDQNTLLETIKQLI